MQTIPNCVIEKKKSSKRSLKAIGKSLTPTATYVPSLTDPRAELRRLVFEHKVMTRKAVAILAMISDRKSRETGEVIPCRGVDDYRKVELGAVVDGMKADAKKLESSMTKELKKIPIYQVFLSKVFGVGPIVAAYLVAELDPRKGEKPSAWRRFCGLAVIDGRLERGARGEKNKFSKEMRVRIYQAFCAMWKNAAKSGKWVEGSELPDDADAAKLEARVKEGRHQYKIVREAAPYGVTSKYLQIWYDYKHRMAQSERVVDGKIVNGAGKTVSAKGLIHSTGWHKAADVLIEDLYVVWRALEGLPVWPSYYAAKLGYEHLGKTCVQAPKMLTIEEALALVGDVGARPKTAPIAQVEDDDVEDWGEEDELI